MSDGVGKEAVVFILDASPSMNTLYPSTRSNDISSSATASTRFSCAKQAIEAMICDLILKSKTNEVMVLVLKTPHTQHHLCCDQQVKDGTAAYPHITRLDNVRNENDQNDDLNISGVTKPTIHLIRELRKVEVTQIKEGTKLFDGGDFCEGLIVAADAIFRRTQKLKFRRRIVIFTDAAHETNMIGRSEEMNRVIGGLRDMNCSLEVVGLDFTQSAEFDKPFDITSNNKSNTSSRDVSNTEAFDNDCEESLDDEQYKALVKRENEALLIGIARLTSGSVTAASTMHEMLATTSGKRIPKSTQNKAWLKIAPSIEVVVQFSLMLSEQKRNSLKTEAVLLDVDGRMKKDSNGNSATSKVLNRASYWELGR